MVNGLFNNYSYKNSITSLARIKREGPSPTRSISIFSHSIEYSCENLLKTVKMFCRVLEAECRDSSGRHTWVFSERPVGTRTLGVRYTDP